MSDVSPFTGENAHPACGSELERSPTPADPKNVTEVIAAQDLQVELQYPRQVANMR